jgi:hypothetical protein
LASVSATTGCGPSFRRTGYLADYSKLTFSDPHNSDLAWEELRDAPPPDVIFLSPILVRPGVFDDPELEARVVEVLTGQLYRRTINRYGGALRIGTREPNLDTMRVAGRVPYELEVAVTDAREGVGVLRWLLGFGLGASKLQIEGHLRTWPDRMPVARFACRVVHPGLSYMGLNPKALSATYVLSVSADWAAYDISALPSLLHERWAEIAASVVENDGVLPRMGDDEAVTPATAAAHTAAAGRDDD